MYLAQLQSGRDAVPITEERRRKRDFAASTTPYAVAFALTYVYLQQTLAVHEHGHQVPHGQCGGEGNFCVWRPPDWNVVSSIQTKKEARTSGYVRYQIAFFEGYINYLVLTLVH